MKIFNVRAFISMDVRNYILFSCLEIVTYGGIARYYSLGHKRLVAIQENLRNAINKQLEIENESARSFQKYMAESTEIQRESLKVETEKSKP